MWRCVIAWPLAPATGSARASNMPIGIDTYSQDNNALYHRQSKQVEVGLDVHLYNSRWIMSLYGKNLLNEANHGAVAVSRNPDNGFGSAALLSKGRIYGLELTYRFR